MSAAFVGLAGLAVAPARLCFAWVGLLLLFCIVRLSWVDVCCMWWRSRADRTATKADVTVTTNNVSCCGVHQGTFHITVVTTTLTSSALQMVTVASAGLITSLSRNVMHGRLQHYCSICCSLVILTNEAYSHCQQQMKCSDDDSVIWWCVCVLTETSCVACCTVNISVKSSCSGRRHLHSQCPRRGF